MWVWELEQLTLKKRIYSGFNASIAYLDSFRFSPRTRLNSSRITKYAIRGLMKITQRRILRIQNKKD
jgi:hypothetical protein